MTYISQNMDLTCWIVWYIINTAVQQLLTFTINIFYIHNGCFHCAVFVPVGCTILYMINIVIIILCITYVYVQCVRSKWIEHFKRNRILHNTLQTLLSAYLFCSPTSACKCHRNMWYNWLLLVNLKVIVSKNF